MTMREKMARAIFDRYVRHAMPLGNPVLDHQEEFRKGQFLGLADAALDALMQPSETMIVEALNSSNGFAVRPIQIDFDFRAMIQAAKDGK